MLLTIRSVPPESNKRQVLPSCLLFPSQLTFLHWYTSLDLSWVSIFFILFQGILQFREVPLLSLSQHTTDTDSCPFSPQSNPSFCSPVEDLHILCVPSLQQGQEEWGAEKPKQPDPYLLQSGSATLSTASGAWWAQTGCTGLSSLKLHDWVM